MQRLHDAGTTASLHVQQLHASKDVSICTSLGAFQLCVCNATPVQSSCNTIATWLAGSDYDVLLRDAMYWPAALLDDALGIPSIDVLSAAPFQPMFGYYTSNPNPVAYLPQLGSGLTPDMVSQHTCCLPPMLWHPTSKGSEDERLF